MADTQNRDRNDNRGDRGDRGDRGGDRSERGDRNERGRRSDVSDRDDRKRSWRDDGDRDDRGGRKVCSLSVILGLQNPNHNSCLRPGNMIVTLIHILLSANEARIHWNESFSTKLFSGCYYRQRRR